MPEEPRRNVRASDADRELVARQLAAAADGRISVGGSRTADPKRRG